MNVCVFLMSHDDVPLDPKTMKNEGFEPPIYGYITPKNEGSVGSHGVIYSHSHSLYLIGFLRGGGDSLNLPQCSLRFPNLPKRNP